MQDFLSSLADLFLSTPSARRATVEMGISYNAQIISIHALREESDLVEELHEFGDGKFLSTPSARRATYQYVGQRTGRTDFYPRPPRGERPFGSWIAFRRLRRFLSTPSARRATSISSSVTRYSSTFLSTPSARRATSAQAASVSAMYISIHALREESDINQIVQTSGQQTFLSTPSARRATEDTADSW